MTLGQWIRANALNAAGRRERDRLLDPARLRRRPERAVVPLHVLWYVACSGDERTSGTFSRNSDTANGAQERRFVGGSQPCRSSWPRSSATSSRCAAPVQRIVQRRPPGAVVSTGRGSVVAKRVIVAAPAADRARHRLAPGAAAPTGASCCATSHMGQLMKCDAIYRTPFWRSAGLNGFGISDHGAARAVFDNTPPTGGPGVLLAFVGGSTWRHVRRTDQGAAPGRACCRGSRRCSAPQALHPVDYVEHDWTKERWTRGGPTAIHAPGTLVPYGGRPYAARSAGCTGPAPRPRRTGRGYMDGAVEPASVRPPRCWPSSRH